MGLKPLLAVNLSLSLPVFAGTPFFTPTKQTCERLEREIASLSELVSNGHALHQTRNLRQQIRELKYQRSQCVKAGFSVE